MRIQNYNTISYVTTSDDVKDHKAAYTRRRFRQYLCVLCSSLIREINDKYGSVRRDFGILPNEQAL